jgi:DNA-binding transcriptional regulator YhcF (GntR family)
MRVVLSVPAAILRLVDDQEEQPPWRQILEIYVGKIKSGELKSGDRLPSIKGISQEYGVAMSTAQKVIEALRNQGLAVTSVMGTFVA